MVQTDSNPNERSESQEPMTTPSSSTVNSPTGKKNKKTVYIIVGIVCVIAAILVGYFLISNRLNNSDEEAAYEILKDNDNPEDYRAYLAQFPNGAHADEVRQSLSKLEAMLAQWQTIALSDNVNDFINFKNTYSDAQYNRFCDIKIDSLDFVRAQREGTEEAFQRYLDVHPDGRYASEASIAKGTLQDQEVTSDDRAQIVQTLTTFFEGFSSQNEETICANITATMKNFLSRQNATKAIVVQTIKGMYNEHILSCQFVVNRDIQIQRTPGKNGAEGSYKVTFTVDQHIQRDNEGKTFGSYQCVAELTPQMLISSLTMTEISQQ